MKRASLIILALAAIGMLATLAVTGTAADAPKPTDSGVVPDPEVVGGESTSTQRN